MWNVSETVDSKTPIEKIVCMHSHSGEWEQGKIKKYKYKILTKHIKQCIINPIKSKRHSHDKSIYIGLSY